MKMVLAIAISASVASQPLLASNKDFVEFAVEKAHERSFIQCDSAIREAFALADGEDIRVITMGTQEIEKDSLKLLVAYGRVGDAVVQEAEFRVVGGRCVYTLTSTLTGDRSCAAEFGELAAFKFNAETAGVVFAENKGGVTLVLTPVGASGCVKTFYRTGEA